jgi:hypothetical protein
MMRTRCVRPDARAAFQEESDDVHTSQRPAPLRRTARIRLRGMSRDGRRMGTPTRLPHLRPRRLLRLVEEPARDEALSHDRHPVIQSDGAGRGLEVVLRR